MDEAHYTPGGLRYPTLDELNGGPLREDLPMALQPSEACRVCHQPRGHSYHEKRGRRWDVPQHPFYPPTTPSTSPQPSQD
jgi:hypothetical protein